MASAYGSWITSSSAGWRTYLEVTATNETATAVTYSCTLKIYSNYGLAVSGGSAYIYAGSSSGGSQYDKWTNSSYTFSFGYAGSGSPATLKSGWTVTVNKGTSAKTVYFTGSAYCPDIKAGRSTAYVSMTVPALATYTVTYNANSGSGAPASQTKTYGVALTLSSTKPTRTNYNFKGWGTSSTATTVAYAPGASYTANADLTLYAIWELAYVEPNIFLMQVDRCLSDGTLSDTGTYAKVQFNWSIDSSVTLSSIKVGYKLATDSSYTYTTVSASGTEGSLAPVIGGGNLSTEYRYLVNIIVTDSKGGSASRTLTVFTAGYIMDVMDGGSAVAFFKVAERDQCLDVGKKVIISAGDDADVSYTPSGYLTVGDPDGEHLALDTNEIMAKSDGFTAGPLILQANGGKTAIGGNVIIGNAKVYCSKNPSGDERSMVQLNTNGDYFYGYGSYLHSEGNSFFDGNAVSIRSKGAVSITSPTAGLSAREYGVNKVLKSTASYMNETQEYTFSEPISAQPHGAMFVWSSFSNNSANNYDWQYFFVSKSHVASHNGTGIWMSDGPSGMRKYVYVSDTSVKGNTVNDDSTTTIRGVSITNTNYVLRYVIGV